MKRLGIVVPCYNEEEIFDYTNEKLTNLVKELIKKEKIAKNSFILFVDDGSKDNTWSKIKEENQKNKHVYGLKLAHNVGHQNALLAGITEITDLVDMSISIDADLQDDINVIEEMIDKFNNGIDIVYGVRNDRTSDSAFKRFTAQSFYKFMKLLGVNSVYNHADFRLMSKRAMEALMEFKERNLFLRGMVPLIGYSTDSVYYARSQRIAGESKYPLKKMLSFALDGITSFSIKPMTIICGLGMTIILVSIIAMIYSIVVYFMGNSTDGWSSLFCSIWFLGGVQLLCIGIIGQYIGKTYIEVKERPRYIVEAFLKENTNTKNKN